MTPEEMYNRYIAGEGLAAIGQMVGKQKGTIQGIVDRYRKKNDLPSISEISRAQKLKPRRRLIDKDNLQGFHDTLKKNNCTYIAGDMRLGTAVFCDQPKQTGKSYCAYHQSLCHTPAPKKNDLDKHYMSGRFGE